MDGATIGILTLIVVNIGAVAYSYGKLSQKVSDLCRRVERIERQSHCEPEVEKRNDK